MGHLLKLSITNGQKGCIHDEPQRDRRDCRAQTLVPKGAILMAEQPRSILSVSGIDVGVELHDNAHGLLVYLDIPFSARQEQQDHTITRGTVPQQHPAGLRGGNDTGLPCQEGYVFEIW